MEVTKQSRKSHRFNLIAGLVMGGIGVFLLTISLTPLYASWTAPTAPPPGNNVNPPLHTGSDLQIKHGGLVLNSVGGSMVGLIVANGPVGIGTGTSTPAAELEVAGRVVSHSTQASDPGNTLVTKDYVDAQGGGGGSLGNMVLISLRSLENSTTNANEETGNSICAAHGLSCVCSKVVDGSCGRMCGDSGLLPVGPGDTLHKMRQVHVFCH